MNVSVRKSWVRRVLNPYSVAVLLLLIAGIGWWAWQQYGGGRNPRDQYQITTVQRGDLEDLVTATGTVQPLDYVDVGAQVSGQLKKLHVEVGSQVESGDLLAEIDPTVLKATVDARRAGLRNQRATLTERESALALATLQHTRQKNLMAADATTTEAVQEAAASELAARAQIAQTRALIEQTESTLRADEANLNYAKIYAPMAGTVVSVTARQGQTLNANQSAPTILQVADLTTMTVKTQVSEAEVSKLRKGMDVYFTTLGGQGRRWYGKLRKVEPTPTTTNNVVLYNALFDVPNTNNALMPSMTTQVFFIAASAKDVLLVPTGAVTLERTNNAGGPRGAGRPGRAASGARGASAPARPDGPPPGQASPPDRAGPPPDLTAGASAPQSASAPEAGASAPRRRPTGGFAGSGGQRTRRGTVKVIDAAGRVEERAVELGVVTRVQAEVLSGLKEGDEIVTGAKLPPAAQKQNNDRRQGNLQQGPGGGMPPPGGGR